MAMTNEGTSKNSNQLVAICSAVGGTGRTTLTVNVATRIANRGRKVSIVDGDLQFGDIAMALDLKPTYTIKEVAEVHDLDNILFYSSKHVSGMQILAAPTRPEYADLIPKDLFQEIVDAMKVETEFLFVETQSGLNEQTLELMDKAEQIMIVATPSMHVLKNTKLMIETLEALGLKKKAQIVINQFTPTSVVGPKKIQEILGIEKIYVLADDSKLVNESLDLGVPIVTTKPKHDFAKGIEKIAVDLIGNDDSTNRKDTLFQSISKFYPKRLEGENS
ncbi:pilus assembly protein CpaE [Oceanobacillus limi]|uniref:Pilus assembly protein CpaE n=1 Tax=Oceanobacillus limi TaxID=930131 RepID=A0A1I0BIP8_9BACI|nr:P-loop NTPase [Oceanobacillus limi]SET06111.1 pilus assembly protein CpaE [Oceanobacillus limi]